ncbi:MAG: exonuclease domain-containing protein [bacterium]
MSGDLHPADIFPVFVSLDLETTGLNPETCEIIELGAVLFQDSKPVSEFSQLIKPNVPTLPPEIVNLTGITDEDLKDAPRIVEVVDDFKEFVSDYPLVGQNIDFDLGFLVHTPGLAPFFKYDQVIGRVYDTKLLARYIYPCLPSYSLSHLSTLFPVSRTPRHRAADDAWVTGELFLFLVNELLGVPEYEIEEALNFLSGYHSYLGNILKAVLSARQKAFFPCSVKGKDDLNLTNSAPDPFFGSSGGKDNIYQQSGMKLNSEELTGGSLKDKVTILFKNTSHLSQVIPQYEDRLQQREMAKKVSDAFDEGGIVVVEAGTGVGKSLAYLIPALLSGKPVAISSYTKTLQDQLFFREIPRLGKILPLKFTAVLLKGRENYLCLTKWNNLKSRVDGDLNRAWREKLACLVRWVHATKTGDLSEPGDFAGDIKDGKGLLNLIASQRGYCIGRICSQGKNLCPYQRIRQATNSADIVVVNHALTLTHFLHQDLSAEHTEQSVGDSHLSRFHYWVIDEAHRFEDSATQVLSTAFSFTSLRSVVERIVKLTRLRGELWVTLAQWGKDTWVASSADIARKGENLIDQAQAFFTILEQWIDDFLEPEEKQLMHSQEFSSEELLYSVVFRYDEETLLGQFIVNEGFTLKESWMSWLESLNSFLNLVIEDERSQTLTLFADFFHLVEEANLTGAAIEKSLIAKTSERVVYWLEIDYNSEDKLWLKTAPLDVSDQLAYRFFERVDGVVLTSATLSTGRDFI